MKKQQEMSKERRGFEDPGVQGMKDSEYALSAAEHAETVKGWLRKNDSEKFKRLFPKG